MCQATVGLKSTLEIWDCELKYLKVGQIYVSLRLPLNPQEGRTTELATLDSTSPAVAAAMLLLRLTAAHKTAFTGGGAVGVLLLMPPPLETTTEGWGGLLRGAQVATAATTTAMQRAAAMAVAGGVEESGSGHSLSEMKFRFSDPLFFLRWLWFLLRWGRAQRGITGMLRCAVTQS